MSELFSIQLQNRQQQGGDGVWLDLPTTTEQVQAALRQIGISSDNPQGLFISGYFAEEEKRFAIPYNMVLASNVGAKALFSWMANHKFVKKEKNAKQKENFKRA